MEQPLALLKRRSSEAWLIGYDCETLVKLAEQRYQDLLKLDSPSMILSDRNPVSFIASFIAACSVPCHIFLCNPDWSESEQQQAIDLAKLPAIANPMIMIPTGGTSGKIRFVMHTWETLTASVEGFQRYFECAHVNSFCVLPLYHVSGLMQLMRSLLSDGKLIIKPWKDLNTCQIDPSEFFLSLVPTQLQRLMHRADWLAQFKTILLGGAPAWDELLDQARSHQIPLAPTYGMTETASQIATLKPIDFLRGQTGCGQVLPHANLSIHPETQKISIQAKSLMLGYYPMLSNATSYEPDDLGFLDDRGFLHILGRDSDKIITGGENVFPSEVEAAIRATHLVEDVCVIGLPDRTWGEVVTAIYVPKNGTQDELILALSPLLTKFKQPKRWIAIAELPRNAQGKLRRDRILGIATNPTSYRRFAETSLENLPT